MKKKLAVAGLGLGLLFSGALISEAGTTLTGYNVTAGPINGSGFSSPQTKSISSYDGYLNSTTVSGGYKVDVRMSSVGSNGYWVRVGNNISALLVNEIQSGKSAYLEVSNDLTTPVSVTATGTWASN